MWARAKAGDGISPNWECVRSEASVGRGLASAPQAAVPAHASLWITT